MDRLHVGVDEQQGVVGEPVVHAAALRVDHEAARVRFGDGGGDLDLVGEAALVARLAHVGEAQQGDHARRAADRGLGGVLSHEVGYRGAEEVGELTKDRRPRRGAAAFPLTYRRVGKTELVRQLCLREAQLVAVCANLLPEVHLFTPLGKLQFPFVILLKK